MIDFRLCLITDRAKCRPASPGARMISRSSKTNLNDAIDAACGAGVRLVQLREKDLDARELFELALDLRSVTSHHVAALLVNDRVDVALAAGLDGVHCPDAGFPPATARQLLGTESLVGASCHSLDGVRRAAESGADFVFFGPVYETPSKAAYGPPAGLDALKQVCAETAIPVLAVGGVTPERSPDCIAAGAVGVAVISAILSAEDIPERVKAFEKALGAL
jgi:thiamine-phosphate pyrophosphorylase